MRSAGLRHRQRASEPAPWVSLSSQAQLNEDPLSYSASSVASVLNSRVWLCGAKPALGDRWPSFGPAARGLHRPI